MTEDRDRLAKEAFERVLDAAPERREAVLAEATRGDAALRAQVESLLAAEAQMGDFLETSAAERLGSAPAAPAHLDAGEVVGDFTVLGVLGEGGGGVVHEAMQREPVRRVALKFVRARSRDEAALRAFRDEAANLARLQHPGIAHVYAAGVDERYGPWIAMELVHAARSIVRYAEDERLTLGTRLRLFVGVCEAIHHAHQKGVIHRDVKPGNVLVDDDGRAKVVDFGVACGSADADAAQAAGTLVYASPEQFETGGGVDVRADVYALGVLLYELLTGAVPHDLDDATVGEAVRRKREETPVPPSVRRPSVPADLSSIVRRAMAPEREARYGTAAALAEDVTRFLDGLPVAAHGAGRWYLLGKFARRRKAVALALAAAAAAIVGGVGVSLWFAVENAAERDRAERRSYAASVSAASAALRVDDVAEARRRLALAPEGLRDWEWRHLTARTDVSAATIRFPGRELWGGAACADGSVLAVGGQRVNVAQETRHFAAAARPDGTVLHEWTSSSGNVPCVALSPDGRLFAAGFNDGTVRVRDLATGAEPPALAAHSGTVIRLVFSPDGRRLATASADGTAKLFDTSDWACLRTFQGHGDRVVGLAFDAAGTRLVAGVRDGRIHVWDVQSGARIRVIAGHTQSVEAVAVSPDGLRLASASRDRTVRLWNLADGAAISVQTSHTSNVRDVAFDPAGGLLVSASWDGTLRLWDAVRGDERGVLRGHGGAVCAAAFVRGEPRLVSFSWDGTVKRWDVRRTEVPACSDLGDRVDAIAFDPTGARVVAGCQDGTVVVLDAATAAVLWRTRAPFPIARIGFVDAAATGREALGAWGLVWDAPDAAPGGAFPPGESIFGLRWGATCLEPPRRPEFAWAVTSERGEKVSHLVRARISDRAQVDIREAPYSARACAMAVGSGWIASGAEDGTIALWPLSGTAPVAPAATVRPHTGPIRSLAFDGTGSRLLSASEDGTAAVLSVPGLATHTVLRGHAAAVYDAAFLPGGRRAVTVSRDHTVRIWDTESGENVLVLHGHAYPVVSVAVSPDGTRIATGAGSTEDPHSDVRIWSAPAER